MSDNLDELGVNGEFEEDGREIVLDTSGEVELTDDATEGVAELRDTIAQQNSEAEQYAIEFLKKVVRIRGVRITRDEFLRQELRKLHMSDEAITRAVDSNPVLAGVCLTDLDMLADGIISFEDEQVRGDVLCRRPPRWLRDARHDTRGPDPVLRACLQDHAEARLPVRLA